MSTELERFCIVQPYETAWQPPYGNFQRIRPGYLRKVYPPAKRSRRIYLGAALEPRDELRDVNEIVKLVDTRPLAELEREVENAIKQILYRAHCGDKKALLRYVLAVRAAVVSLQTLTKRHTGMMRAEAESFSDWPVLLSLNPQDIESAKQELKSLGVGTRSPLPTRPGQRVDRRNFWTRLAIQALTACAANKRRVPELKALGAGAKRQRKTDKFWATTVKATFYTLANGDEMIITDWQNKCVKLSGPIQRHNFLDWWNVVKSCVLEFWKNPKGNYAEALKRIGRANEEESRRRNLAIDRLEQAFRSLVGLQ